ncbi:MAG: tetratricopeptide repeat protein [Elusimicrobia bacterium]|nr:tetratricopeptide repeat protein [Elusimicrobiota bacterium]
MQNARLSACAAMALALTTVFLIGCGADRDFRKADFLESSGRAPAAARALEDFADRHPEDPRAAQALVRAARIYARTFHRYEEARFLYERAARWPFSTRAPENIFRGQLSSDVISEGAAPGDLSEAGAAREHASRAPWPAAARRELLDCPEYFPLRQGTRWVYVDSQTGGRNMRLELKVSASTEGATGRISGAYYAGSKRFKTYRRSYAKQDWAIWEGSGKERLPILRYPYSAQTAWTGARDGRPVRFSIEPGLHAVAVRAGTFGDCLKVREASPGENSWSYHYYAPGVGRVKTTVGGSGFEFPNTELGSYSIP